MQNAKLSVFLLVLFVIGQALIRKLLHRQLAGALPIETKRRLEIEGYEPSDTVYCAVTNNDGRFAVHDMRTG